MRGGGEPRHVATCLGGDGVGDRGADARDRTDQLPEPAKSGGLQFSGVRSTCDPARRFRSIFGLSTPQIGRDSAESDPPLWPRRDVRAPTG